VENKDLKELLEILKNSGVTEFEMEKEGVKLKINRGAFNSQRIIEVPVNVQQNLPVAPVVADVAPAQTDVIPAKKEQKEANLESQEGIHIIKSPIVGTLYRKPNPKADPYVDIGSIVKAGQIVCIVEAMKLMNEIAADVAGEIVKIYVENSRPVEYGEPLFAIKTM
jgi:acetyl-CoA carboxylase biotin carboxyl carrier protein